MYKRVNSYNLSFWPFTQATFNCFTKFPSTSTQLTQGHGHFLCLPNKLIRRQGEDVTLLHLHARDQLYTLTFSTMTLGPIAQHANPP